MNRLDIDKIYVLHVKKGYEERLISVKNQFANLDNQITFILDGDIPDLTEFVLNTYFGDGMRMANPATSCAYKHILALQDLVQNNIPYALILEDDFLFRKKFVSVFNETIKEMQQFNTNIKDKLFISYENSNMSYVPKNMLEKNVYLYQHDTTRCAGAYLISRNLAVDILNDIAVNKCTFAIDWYYEYFLKNNKIPVYWCHPPIVEQGSHNGVFVSGIGKNRFGVFRKFVWWVMRFNREYIKPFFRLN